MAFQKQKVFLSVPVFPVAVSHWSPGQPLFLSGGPAPAVTEEQGEEPNTTVQLSRFNSLLSIQITPLTGARPVTGAGFLLQALDF